MGDPAINAAAQRDDPRSMLALHRELIALRREFVDEPYETLAVDDAHARLPSRGPFVVALNLSDEPAERPRGARAAEHPTRRRRRRPAPERGRGRQPVTPLGSTAAPRRRSSKCRCGPVERPVEPTRPMSAPAATHWPRPDRDPRQVRVPARHPLTVPEDDELAVAAGVAVRDLDAPARARVHRPPARRDEVEAGVEAWCRAGRSRRRPDRRPGAGSAAASAAAGGAARRASRRPRRRRPRGLPTPGSGAARRRCGRRGRRRPCRRGSRGWRAGTAARPRPSRGRAGSAAGCRAAAARGGRARAASAGRRRRRPGGRAARWSLRTAAGVAGPATPSTLPA